jgi:hypothetical protein
VDPGKEVVALWRNSLIEKPANAALGVAAFGSAHDGREPSTRDGAEHLIVDVHVRRSLGLTSDASFLCWYPIRKRYSIEGGIGR